MTLSDIIAVHNLVDRDDPESYFVAANLAIQRIGGTRERVKSRQQGRDSLEALFYSFLNLDLYVEAALLAWGDQIFNPRPRAVQIVWNALAKYNKILAIGGSAQSKCLGKGTKVLMFNGEVKAVEAVAVGDQLMGDDSTPREVLSLHRGHGAMVEICPKQGSAWRCNKEHILTLVSSVDKRNGDGKTFSSTFSKGRIIDIPIREWLAKSNTFRQHFKQFRVPVEFPASSVEYDPYIYGLWLGDGGANHAVLHNTDPILINAWQQYFESLGFRVVASRPSEGHTCLAYYARIRPVGGGGGVSNPFLDFVRKSHDGEKRIRREYLINSRAVRLQVLAGLIDTDGWVNDPGFAITIKGERFARDIAFLARSLGFRTSNRQIKSGIKSTGFVGVYQKINIGGNVAEIPTRLKKASPRKSNCNSRVTAIEVKAIPDDDFYGFELSGNGRFLLDDFTVTHNTYASSARTLLRWVRDPQYTTVKLISTTGGHARANIYSTFVRLHSQSIIPLPGEVRQNFIALDPNDLHSAIAKVSIQPGESGEAALKGFHPLPRPSGHPVFGIMSYSIALLDEAGNIPYGAWKGVDNIASTRNVQVYAATNPVNINDEFGVRAEPLDGWDSFNREEDTEWDGHEGWKVIRLDPAKSENVQQRKLIYQGFMDYEGFKAYESKGLTNPDYDIYARGRYPVATAQYNVVPANILGVLRGTYHFTGATENWATFDGGYALGGDAALLTTGRYGLANAFTNAKGFVTRFQPKYVAIAEQQIEVERVIIEGEPNSILMGDNLIVICTNLHVRPEWFAMDRTGSGQGIYDYLRLKFGMILGINWGEAATDKKIMEEDSLTAEEQFLGVVSEMWFAFSQWAEYGNFKVAPNVQKDKLFAQLGNRKYTYASKTLRSVESKADYKKNNREESPNEADSLIMGPHLFRLRDQTKPAMIPPKRLQRPNTVDKNWHWPDDPNIITGDAIEFVDID